PPCPPTLALPFFSSSSGDHPDLHSFPTRRSSDLDEAALLRLLGGEHVTAEDQGGRPLLPDPLAHPPEVSTAGMDADVEEARVERSEEHTSELQSRENLVCRLLLEKKKKYNTQVQQ